MKIIDTIEEIHNKYIFKQFEWKVILGGYNTDY